MKTWTMPRIAVDTFVPNEFISTCIPTGEGGLNGMWEETNGIPGLQQSRHNVTTDPKYMPYADTCERDPEVHTSNAVDKLYPNDYGWVYVRLTPGIENPKFFRSGTETYDQDAWTYYVEDGRIFYQTWRIDQQVITNAS